MAPGIDTCQYRWMSKSNIFDMSAIESVACCPPLAREPLTEAQAEQVAPLLRALAGLAALIGTPAA